MNPERWKQVDQILQQALSVQNWFEELKRLASTGRYSTPWWTRD